MGHKVTIHGLVAAIGVLMITCCLPATYASTQNVGQRAVPSDFIRELSLPGQTNHFLRPGQVFFDSAVDELYVVDQGHNRIVVCNANGVYRFEFSVEAYCGSVRDLVVTSGGRILILGSTSRGLKLLQFDFDGAFLGEAAHNMDIDNRYNRILAMAIDSHDRVYVLEGGGPSIVCLSADLSYERGFPILTGLDDKAAGELIFGSLTCIGDELLLPVSSLGAVYRYSLAGEFLGTIGHQGTKVGELSFPAAVSHTSDSLILVLDKQRSAVLGFTIGGRFLGEFGGMGISPGWFYYPSKIAVDSHDRVYISQIFMNRVQVCGIPESIQHRLLSVRRSEAATESRPDAGR